MERQTHIIDRLFLEVDTPSISDAHRLKDSMDTFLKQQVLPEIEVYLNKKSALYPNAVVKVDRLQLDLNSRDFRSAGHAKDDIIIGVKNKIDAALYSAIVGELEDLKGDGQENRARIIPADENTIDLFFQFLKSGKGPWWKTKAFLPDKKAMKRLVIQPEFRMRFRRAIRSKIVQDRLVQQFDDSFLELLLGQKAPQMASARKKAVCLLLKNDHKLRTVFWKTFFDSLQSTYPQSAKQLISEQLLEVDLNAEEKKAIVDYAVLLADPRAIDMSIDPLIEFPELVKETHEELEEGVYVQQAGVVLLHPFFKTFFVNTKLADASGQLLPEKIETAIHLLHYVSTKQEQQLESELTLEKFLCGYPIKKPITRYLKLSKSQKKQAEELLRSIIAHWPALKNTSPDGLRTGFLQREGKWIEEEDKYRLIVERKGMDILLDKIPWNTNLIKFPWLDKLIFVEW